MSGQEQQQPQRAIQPPSQQMPSNAFSQGLGFGQMMGADSLAGMSLNGRSFTPSQQRFPGMLRSNESTSFINQLPQTISGQAPPPHTGLFQNQAQQLAAPPGHARQSSRYNFASDPSSASAAIKPAANAKLMAQQSAMMPSGASLGQHQQGFAGPFYGSAVQGPPPGLKSAGTPPMTGDGMFSQGLGFAGGLGAAAGLGGVDDKSELLRGVLRPRGGVNGAGSIGQASEAGKREYLFPSLLQQQYPSSSTPSPAPGFSGPPSLSSSLFGVTHGGNFQDLGQHKPKKNKGKKHRHANTSSSGGGGIVNLADPSILQARMHQPQTGVGNAGVGAVSGGQAFFGGGQGQGGYNPSMLYGNGGFGRW
jgi:CCR4-NOT transcription complex subunit 4